MVNGYFLISLDFELMWGVKDIWSIQDYGSNILGARKAIPKILQIFNEKGIHCTWATVGLLFSDSKTDTVALSAERRPGYHNPKLSSYTYLDEIGDGEKDDEYHFGSSLIRLIMQYNHQEIASHTFSHYYCLEDGQTRDEFESDILAAKTAAQRFGINIRSLVLPRNQMNMNYLGVLTGNNIVSFRGNEKNWLYKAVKGSDDGLAKRLGRLIDTYINLSGHNCYPLDEAITEKNLMDLRSSRFLRPYSNKLRLLEGLKIRRIKSQMKYAAKHKLVFHLWWHPHNFGANTQKNIENLVKILDYYTHLNKKYGFASKNMGELSMEVLHNEDCHARR